MQFETFFCDFTNFPLIFQNFLLLPAILHNFQLYRWGDNVLLTIFVMVEIARVHCKRL